MQIKIFIIAIITLNSCTQPYNSKNKVLTKETQNKLSLFQYKDTTIPDFFKSYINNHLHNFKSIELTDYIKFCKKYNLNSEDSQNVIQYFTIDIIHKLFTANGASNGSVGEIIKIPYYWHWTTPNPRHEILQIKSGMHLSKLKTLNTHPNYSSFADIDRTPGLFLTDLFKDYPQYKSNLCDSFSTFGWCSEREMAFISILEMLGFEGKIIAEGNHCWSIIKTKMIDNELKQKTFKVKVDNTFNQVIWSELTDEDISQWNKYLGNVPLAKWYNNQAHSQIQKSEIRRFKISPSAIKNIEESTINYFRKALQIK